MRAQSGTEEVPLTFGVGLIAVAYASWLTLEVVLLARERARRGEGTSRDQGSWRITYGGCVAAVAVATATGLWLPVADLPGGEVRRLLGGGLALAGVGFRWWAVTTLGAFFRVAVNIADRQHVVDDGPYRFVRHPSYTGLIAVVVGLGIGLGDVVGLAACLVLAPAALIYRINVEERALRTTMDGAYGEYAAGKARLLPGIW